jgi:hypothetical protein
VNAPLTAIGEWSGMTNRMLDTISANFIRMNAEIGHQECCNTEIRDDYSPTHHDYHSSPIPVPRSGEKVTLVAGIPFDGSSSLFHIIFPPLNLKSYSPSIF